mgnify:CR=1 FL=1
MSSLNIYPFRMKVVITYQTTNPRAIDCLYERTNQAIQSLMPSIGYTVAWGASKIRIPIYSMEQSVTESNSLTIERDFFLPENVRNLVRLLSALFDLLSSTGGVRITYTMAKE